MPPGTAVRLFEMGTGHLYSLEQPSVTGQSRYCGQVDIMVQTIMGQRNLKGERALELGIRVSVIVVSMVVVSIILGDIAIVPRATAQDGNPEATVSALQTEVAAQQTEVARLQTAAAGTVSVAAYSTPTPIAPSGTPQPELPTGIPSGAEKGEVTDHVDGDTFIVRTPRGVSRYDLLGVDAPDLQVTDNNAMECYAEEAADHLARMLPEGRDVYLENDENAARLQNSSQRFVWFIGKSDRKAYLANELLIERGFAAVESTERHNDRLETAQARATEDEAGLWKVCGGPHVVTTPTPVPPTPTPNPEEIKAQHTVLVDVRELATRPGSMLRDKIAFSGEVFTIQVATPGNLFTLGDNDSRGAEAALQIYVTARDGYREAVFVGYNGDTSGIFEGTWVTVYGSVVGTESGTNRLGGVVTQPFVMAEIIEIL